MHATRQASPSVPAQRQRNLDELKQLLGFRDAAEVTLVEEKPSEVDEALDVHPETKASFSFKVKATATCARTDVKLDVTPAEADTLKAAGARVVA